MSEKMRSDRQIGHRLRLRDLYVFSTVAEHSSMAKAAADLGVTQPSVSEVIADLENAYGVKLFDRGARGVQLTAYGEALLRRTAAVFDEIRQSAVDIQSIDDPTRGEIRIASLEGLSAAILPEILLQFARQHPHVIVHVDNMASGSLDMTGLRNRLYDLALVRVDDKRTTSLGHDDLNVSTLYDEDLVVAAGAHNPWTRRPDVRLADLIDEPWILSPPGFWHHARTAEAFLAQGLTLPQPRIVSVTITLRMHLMAAGPYISVFTGGVMRNIAHRFQIAALPVTLPTRSWPVVVVTLKNRTLRPVVERFIQSAREVAGSFVDHPAD